MTQIEIDSDNSTTTKASQKRDSSPPCEAPRIFLRTEVLLGWLFGLSWALLIGAKLFPIGMQATLLSEFLTVAFAILARKRDVLSRELIVLLSLNFVNSLSFAFNTNWLVLSLNFLVLIFVSTMALAPILFLTPGVPNTSQEYFRAIVNFLACGRPTNLRGNFSQFFSAIPLLRKIRIHSGIFVTVWISVWLSAFVLSVFHLLLSEVNEEYAKFVHDIFHVIWNILVFIYNLNIFEIIWVTTFAGFLFFFSILPLIKRNYQSTKTQNLPLIGTFSNFLLLPLMALLGIFCIFQIQSFWVKYANFTYKQLSLYTQKGFWQLLVVSLLAGSLWLFTARQAQQTAELPQRVRWILGILAAELLLLSVFSHHKLLLQQYFFGLRDRRVIATFGVSLLSLTFVLFGLEVLAKCRRELTFKLQYSALFTGVLIFSFGNLEATMQRVFPIRFEYGGTMYKDYSYLLTNSLDNVEMWPELMCEAMKTGIPIPVDYYWHDATGGYSSLCEATERSFKTSNLRLLSKYSDMDHSRSLSQVATLNITEYKAILLIQKERALFEAFYSFVDAECWKQEHRNKDLGYGGAPNSSPSNSTN